MYITPHSNDGNPEFKPFFNLQFVWVEKITIQKINALVREATPAAANVTRGANGVSETPMACDTGLVEPAPF